MYAYVLVAVELNWYNKICKSCIVLSYGLKQMCLKQCCYNIYGSKRRLANTKVCYIDSIRFIRYHKLNIVNVFDCLEFQYTRIQVVLSIWMQYNITEVCNQMKALNSKRLNRYRKRWNPSCINYIENKFKNFTFHLKFPILSYLNDV